MTSSSTVPISAVISCYRCADTVSRAVESVVRQTSLPRELILVDDASPDDGETLAALRGLAARFNDKVPVSVLSLGTNQGAAGARNAGWDAASQPYIALLDADDAWHPRKLELQHAWMSRHPEIVLTGHRIVEAGREPALADTLEGLARPIGPALLLISNRFQTSSAMLRRSLPERFAAGKRYCEDYLLWLEIILRGRPACLLDAVLAFRYKPAYGAGGLSGRLWSMQRGELDALARVRRARLLGLPTFVAAAAWSCVKFIRRLAAAPRFG